MLCKPANLILLISIGGAVYHLITGEYTTLLWWLLVGVFGVATFQSLCIGNFENMAWFLMLIPVILVCFFMAIAILASSIRVRTVIPCQYCKRQGCDGSCRRPRPKCNRSSCDGTCETCMTPCHYCMKQGCDGSCRRPRPRCNRPGCNGTCSICIKEISVQE